MKNDYFKENISKQILIYIQNQWYQTPNSIQIFSYSASD